MPCLKRAMTFPGLLRSFTEKENQIGSVWIEILWYTYTQTGRDILFLLHIIYGYVIEIPNFSKLWQIMNRKRHCID